MFKGTTSTRQQIIYPHISVPIISLSDSICSSPTLIHLSTSLFTLKSTAYICFFQWMTFQNVTWHSCGAYQNTTVSTSRLITEHNTTKT